MSRLRGALRRTALCWLALPAARALAIARPAPGDPPAAVPYGGPRADVLALAGLLVAVAAGAVVWWYRSNRRP